MKNLGGVWKMGRRARQALVSAGEIAIPPDAWPQEPDGFDGLKFGMSPGEVAGIIELGERISLDHLNVAFQVRLNIGSLGVAGRLDFHSDQLIMVSGEFDIAGWDSVRSNFMERYGIAHRQKKSLSDGRPFEELSWSSDWLEIGLQGSLGLGETGRFHFGPSSKTSSGPPQS
jgi:hypothetical protein